MTAGKRRINVGILIFSLTAFLLSACSNASNKTCSSAKGLMKKTINAINDNNTDEYASLVDFDVTLKLAESAEKKDTNYRAVINMLKYHKDEAVETCAMGYYMLIGALEKIYKLDKWHFVLKGYKLNSTEKVSGFLIEKYTMKLENENKSKWSLIIYLTKHNNCYFITEPIESSYLSKGW